MGRRKERTGQKGEGKKIIGNKRQERKRKSII